MAEHKTFSVELFDKICERISSSSLGVHAICKMEGTTAQTFYTWMNKDPELIDKYARAKELQADYLFEEMFDIADDSSDDTKVTSDGRTYTDHENIQRAKLRVDTRKFAMSKLFPKKYGDRMDVTSDGKAIPAPIIRLANTDDTDN